MSLQRIESNELVNDISDTVNLILRLLGKLGSYKTKYSRKTDTNGFFPRGRISSEISVYRCLHILCNQVTYTESMHIMYFFFFNSHG